MWGLVSVPRGAETGHCRTPVSQASRVWPVMQVEGLLPLRMDTESRTFRHLQADVCLSLFDAIQVELTAHFGGH